MNIQLGFVKLILHSGICRMLLQHLSVLYDLRDVGMGVDNGDLCVLFPLFCPGFDIQVRNALLQAAVTEALGDQADCLFPVCICYAFQHFKGIVRISSGHPQSCRHVDPLQAAGIGNGYALYVLDDISAAAQLHVIRECTQDISCLSRRISKGNGLRAAQGRDQLCVQDIDIVIILDLIHTFPLLGLI